MKILFPLTICLLPVITLAENVENLTFVMRVTLPSNIENTSEVMMKSWVDISKYSIYEIDEETWMILLRPTNSSKTATVEQNIQEVRNYVEENMPPFIQVKGILSGFYCEKYAINETILLPLTKLNNTIIVNDMTVKCGGSPYRGARWSQSDIEVIVNPLITYNDISQFANNLTLKRTIAIDEIRSLAVRVNQVANQNSEMLNTLQEKNDTNLLLTALDKVLLKSSKVSKFAEEVLDQCAVRVENNNGTGGNGIAIVEHPEENATGLPGQKYYLRSLNRNDPIEMILQLNLTVAIQLPASALQGKNRVVYTVFSNGSIFKVNSLKSAVIGVAIEGESVRKFDEPVRLYFRRFQSVSPNPGKCVYWDFNANSKYGNWSEEGCRLHKVHYNKTNQNSSESDDPCRSIGTDEDIVIDEFYCDHLTHFGELMLDHDVYRCKSTDPILDQISLWGSVLSLAFLLIYIGIAVFNKAKLLQRPGQKSKLQLTIVFAILMVLFVIGSQVRIQSHTGKTALGVSMHYFIVCNFIWMFNAAILQYRRLVIVIHDKSKKFRRLLSLMAWILPIFPPLIAYSVGGKDVYSEPPMYLPRGLLFVLTIILPFAVVMIFNVIVFIWIAVILYSKPKMRVHGKKKESLVRLKQLVFLFFLFGISWMFALGQLLVKQAFVYIFSYLFVISISMQGFVYFVLFVVMDKDVRNLWWDQNKKEWTTCKL